MLSRCQGNAIWIRRENIPQWNWIVILGLNMITNVVITLPVPSMYKFITTPRELSREIDKVNIVHSIRKVINAACTHHNR